MDDVRRAAGEPTDTWEGRASYDPDPEPDPSGLPVFSEDGVDLRLIRWFLSLTPEQRLDWLQSWADLVWEARYARATGKVQGAPRGS